MHGRAWPVASIRRAIGIMCLPLVLVVALVLGVAFGTVAISPLTIIQILLHKAGLLSSQAGWPAYDADIVWQLRLPRVLAAAIVGASLGVAGALFQAILRNPLADPYVIGTSAGAQLGVTIALLAPLPISVLGFGSVQLAALAGAVATVVIVFAVARVGPTTPTVTLILAGFAISSFLISATTFAAYANNRISQVLIWTLGGIEVDRWGQLGAVIIPVVLAMGIAMLLAPQLDVLSLGEEQASHLGIRVERLKLVGVVIGALLTALAVSLAGIIAFVGLVVPHVIRMAYGPGHRMLVPGAAVGGAAFLVLADLAARVVVQPTEVPLGIMTAIIGAPFFLHLLRRSKRVYAV